MTTKAGKNEILVVAAKVKDYVRSNKMMAAGDLVPHLHQRVEEQAIGIFQGDHHDRRIRNVADRRFALDRQRHAGGRCLEGVH